MTGTCDDCAYNVYDDEMYAKPIWMRTNFTA